MKKNSFILIGFDRSGTSAISRTLAAHPEVELIFRPFNSGPVRKKMYEILDDTNVSASDIDFFKALEIGVLKSDYFVSQWHVKFSTVKEAFALDKLHAIITNINHFTVAWISRRFPGIEQWGIWRDPVAILNSCVKNCFFEDWYGDAIDKVVQSVMSNAGLKSVYGDFAKHVSKENHVIKTAFLIAVRNYFLFTHIDRQKVINYDTFREDPNVALRPVVEHFGLNNQFDFMDFLNVDLNSIPSIDGYRKEKTSENILDATDLAIAEELFQPLYRAYPTND